MNNYKGKEIKDILRERISAMKLDERLPSEAALCKEFSVSRMTVNKIINCLANDGLLYRIKGSGTFVKSPSGDKQPVKFLLPCPEYFMYDCTYNLRLLLCGILQETSKRGLQVDAVPVSKVNNPEKIDWGILDDFSAETTVIVPGWWYQEVFPFLRDRGCRAIFCDLHSGTDKKLPAYFSGWLTLTLDTRRAMSETVQLLAGRGCKKIAYVYDDYPDDDPRNAGYRAGLTAAGLELDPELIIYTGNVDSYFERLMNPATDFDALLPASPALVRQTMLLLNNSGRKAPDDFKILVFGDHERLQNFDPPLSAVSLPHLETGRRIAEILIKDVFKPGNMEFETTIFERESLSKGAGPNPNPGLTVSGKENSFTF